MVELSRREQSRIWDFYKPRHTHSWNMLVLSWRELENLDEKSLRTFEDEYFWENFIIRLWLYRTTIKTLTKLPAVEAEAKRVVDRFDNNFVVEGRNSLKALRDMIEHFDDYAAGVGRGPGERERDLDPWRSISRDRFERGKFVLERQNSYQAAIDMRSAGRVVSDNFIRWYKAQGA